MSNPYKPPSEKQGIQGWLNQVGGSPLATYCIAAAFGTYFCMYAFRKPFTAGTYDDLTLFGVALKTVLIASQVSGYTISKFIGIKVISEMPSHRRAITIIGLIAIAELALLGFAVLPGPWKAVMLFINGLPLGMVFGLVLAFLEGRKLTESLAAGLCASFIISSGVVKSVGRTLILNYGVSEYWMPFYTGLLFLPGLLFAVWFLNQIPPPSEQDVLLRRERKPMTSADRINFLKKHGLGFGLLVAVFVLLTIIRSIRDDFGVEIWQGLLPGKEKPEVYSQTETTIAFVVTIINGAAIAIRSNRTALLASLFLTAFGFLVVLGSLLGHQVGSLSPFWFMVLVGLGMYMPYVAFHTTIFERLLASIPDAANLGYLMYIADAVGYLGYVAVMIFRNRSGENLDMLGLFKGITLGISIVSLLLTVVLIGYFGWRIPRENSSQSA